MFQPTLVYYYFCKLANLFKFVDLFLQEEKSEILDQPQNIIKMVVLSLLRSDGSLNNNASFMPLQLVILLVQVSQICSLYFPYCLVPLESSLIVEQVGKALLLKDFLKVPFHFDPAIEPSEMPLNRNTRLLLPCE